MFTNETRQQIAAQLYVDAINRAHRAVAGVVMSFFESWCDGHVLISVIPIPGESEPVEGSLDLGQVEFRFEKNDLPFLKPMRLSLNYSENSMAFLLSEHLSVSPDEATANPTWYFRQSDR